MRKVPTREAVSQWRRARTALLHGLSQLPPPQRRGLVLHHLAGLPGAEVARVEHCPTGTAKARLARGRAVRLHDLGGAAGVAVAPDLTAPCGLAAGALRSPTEATALFGPPEGVSADEVTAEEIAQLDGVTAVDDVSTSADLVRADLEIEKASVPIDLLLRLGLPGSTSC